MTLGATASGAASLSQAFYDIAQLLESAVDSESRVTRVLERLRSFVPYERCAVLEALPERERRLIAAPGTPPAVQAELTATTLALLSGLVDEPGQAARETSIAGTHLAVPLVGLDEVVGVLFVDRAEGAYTEEHVRALSVVAASLAAYSCMLHAFSREAERVVELAKARLAAELADRAKDEFLALVSHELRSPLNSILAWADALRSTGTSEASRTQAFTAIERAVRGHAKLVADLLDLSCIAAASLRLDLRAVEPAQLIKEAVLALRPQAKQKAIKLDVKLDESVTPLLADPERLSQVVVNLIANAIKFTPHGGHVEVQLERAGLLARIRVIDTGTGFGAQVLPKLFEPFSQIDSSTTRAQGGLGVGLALVRDLVELHGGRVRAQSAGEQQGAIFTVELPLAAASEVGREQLDAAPPLRRNQRALAGIRVLLVDDDRDIGEVLQLVLEAQGAVVTIVHSAVEALASLSRSMPDVLLSDLVMPGGSGYDLMRSIIAREGDKAPPAAALSAYAPGQDLPKALASGFQLLLEKPIDPKALIAAVATLAQTSGHVATQLQVEAGRVD